MNAREIGDAIKHRIITIYGCADASMQDVSAAQEMVTQMVAEVERLRAGMEERECDMHDRIRRGYDKTVADCWRAKVAAVTEAARPLMKLMATMHPHHTAIVTCTRVELLEGVVCSGTILDYVEDMPDETAPKEAT